MWHLLCETVVQNMLYVTATVFKQKGRSGHEIARKAQCQIFCDIAIVIGGSIVWLVCDIVFKYQ